MVQPSASSAIGAIRLGAIWLPVEVGTKETPVPSQASLEMETEAGADTATGTEVKHVSLSGSKAFGRNYELISYREENRLR